MTLTLPFCFRDQLERIENASPGAPSLLTGEDHEGHVPGHIIIIIVAAIIGVAGLAGVAAVIAIFCRRNGVKREVPVDDGEAGVEDNAVVVEVVPDVDPIATEETAKDAEEETEEV